MTATDRCALVGFAYRSRAFQQAGSPIKSGDKLQRHQFAPLGAATGRGKARRNHIFSAIVRGPLSTGLHAMAPLVIIHFVTGGENHRLYGALEKMIAPQIEEIDRPLPTALPMTPVLAVFLSIAIAGLFVFSNLGGEPLTDFDEAWHAIIALDIERSNDFLCYNEDGKLTTASVKPPLYFWAMALCFRMLGPSEFAARLFSAFCYVAMVGVVAGFCQKRIHWTVALTVAVLLSTQQQMVYHHGARSAEIDPPLLLFLTLTVLGVYRTHAGGRAWPIGLYWCAALLTKGMAAVQVLPVIVLWFLVIRNFPALRRVLLALGIGTVAAAIFFLIRNQQQPGVIAALFGRELIGRLTTEVDDPEIYPWYYYIEELWRSLLPLALGLIITLISVRFRPRLAAHGPSGSATREMILLLSLWAIIPFMLFNFAVTKRVWYAYPSLVPAYILAGWALRAGLHRLESRPRNRIGPIVALIVLGGQAIPATLASVSFHRSDYLRKNEALRLGIVAGDESGAAAVRRIAYRLSPSNRFELKRTNLDYENCLEPQDVAESLEGFSGTVVLVSQIEEDNSKYPMRELGARRLLRKVEFPARAARVEHWSMIEQPTNRLRPIRDESVFARGQFQQSATNAAKK